MPTPLVSSSLLVACKKRVRYSCLIVAEKVSESLRRTKNQWSSSRRKVLQRKCCQNPPITFMLIGVCNDSHAVDRVREGSGTKKKASNPTAKDPQLSKLESLHERTGVEESLRLGGGRRLKLLDGRPPAKAHAADKPDFDFDFTEVGDRSIPERESSEEMPDVGSVLADLDRQDLLDKPESRPSESYSDPEMDALMQTVDSNGALDDSAHHVVSRHTYDDQTTPSNVISKRTLDQLCSRPPSPYAESPAKKARLSSGPLFIRNSSPSSSPVFTRNDTGSRTKDGKTRSIGHEIEDFFALDDDIFKISFTTEPHEYESTTTSSTVAVDTNTQMDKLDASQLEGKSKPDEMMEDQGNAYDFLADLDDWIENSGCIRIVDSLG